MPSVARQGDGDSGGGVVATGVSSVTVNGAPIAVVGSVITPHNRKPTHHAVAAVGSSTVTAGGIPVNYVGAPDSCGHVRVSGSPDVSVGA